MKHCLLSLLLAAAACGTAHALDAVSTAPAADWMVDPSPYKAEVSLAADRKTLILANGLARRVIRLGPNAATISLKNLVSGEELIRALSPEARVTLGGVEYLVGGLAGQRIQNYLKDEWLDALAPMPGAYQVAGWKEEPVVERLRWRKRPEWLARDLPWPPPGRHVVMRYVPPSVLANPAGPVLFEEKFGGATAVDGGWTVHASEAHDRSGFSNEGKSGEILALPDTAVYAQRSWPAGARSVEVELDAGDDTMSNAWGPGLALVAADGSTVQFVARPNQQVFDTPAGLAGSFDRGRPVRLRTRLEQGTLACEAAQGADGFRQVAAFAYAKEPAALRVGKVGQNVDLPVIDIRSL